MKVHGGNIYDFLKSEDIIDFSSNINPYGPPEFALKAAVDAMSIVNRYPDTEQRALKSSFASWLNVPSESLVFGNGASELVTALLSHIKPSRVLTVAPTFLGYAASASILEIPMVEIPLNSDFSYPLREIRETFREGDLFIACQPNNPTGRAWETDELKELCSICCKSGWLVVDECFVNLSHPKISSSLSALKSDKVITLRAITKDFSAPGLRIGFIIAENSTAECIRAKLQAWPVNSIGEAFAVACAENPEPFLGDSAKLIAAERDYLFDGLESMGFEPFRSAANYILVRSRKLDVKELHNKLLKRLLLIRMCGNFGNLNDSYFRVAVRSRVDNDKLLSAIAMI